MCKNFGAIKAVNNVSFCVKQGELLAMIGPNGAGKSTCFNMMMGQLKATSGKVSLRGEDLNALATRDIWRKGVGRTFQITATYQSMTVVENVQVALTSHNHRTFSFRPYAHKLYREEALEFLRIVGMHNQADRHCAVLAYGDLKRLELAIALCHQPSLLLMDEPTAGMAPKERSALMTLTAEIVREKGISVLFTEHDMDVVFAHAHSTGDKAGHACQIPAGKHAFSACLPIAVCCDDWTIRVQCVRPSVQIGILTYGWDDRVDCKCKVTAFDWVGGEGTRSVSGGVFDPCAARFDSCVC